MNVAVGYVMKHLALMVVPAWPAKQIYTSAFAHLDLKAATVKKVSRRLGQLEVELYSRISAGHLIQEKNHFNSYLQDICYISVILWLPQIISYCWIGYWFKGSLGPYDSIWKWRKYSFPSPFPQLGEKMLMLMFTIWTQWFEPRILVWGTCC